MPISLSYAPISSALQLGQQAGQGELSRWLFGAQQELAQRAMQRQQLQNSQDAQQIQMAEMQNRNQQLMYEQSQQTARQQAAQKFQENQAAIEAAAKAKVESTHADQFNRDLAVKQDQFNRQQGLTDAQIKHFENIDADRQQAQKEKQRLDALRLRNIQTNSAIRSAENALELSTDKNLMGAKVPRKGMEVIFKNAMNDLAVLRKQSMAEQQELSLLAPPVDVGALLRATGGAPVTAAPAAPQAMQQPGAAPAGQVDPSQAAVALVQSNPSLRTADPATSGRAIIQWLQSQGITPDKPTVDSIYNQMLYLFKGGRP